MKAILVIDLPEGYKTEDLLIDYCLHTKGEYKSIRKSGNNLLKPLPQEDRVKAGVGAYTRGFSTGWNACLKEIENG